MILAEIDTDDVTLAVEADADGAQIFEMTDSGCRVLSIPRVAILPVRDGLLRAWQMSDDPRQAVLPLVRRAA